MLGAGKKRSRPGQSAPAEISEGDVSRPSKRLRQGSAGADFPGDGEAASSQKKGQKRTLEQSRDTDDAASQKKGQKKSHDTEDAAPGAKKLKIDGGVAVDGEEDSGAI